MCFSEVDEKILSGNPLKRQRKDTRIQNHLEMNFLHTFLFMILRWKYISYQLQESCQFSDAAKDQNKTGLFVLKMSVSSPTYNEGRKKLHTQYNVVFSVFGFSSVFSWSSNL